jgi:HSP20 family molecular chaperone IbpA
MTRVRYQAPELAPWSAADRWSNLRDDLNSFFELPFWSTSARAGQLFTGWSPALDLYQSNDNVIAVVELPGMRKEDIEISLHDGTLTISASASGKAAAMAKKPSVTSVTSAHSAAASHYRPAWTPIRSGPRIEMEY